MSLAEIKKELNSRRCGKDSYYELGFHVGIQTAIDLITLEEQKIKKRIERLEKEDLKDPAGPSHHSQVTIRVLRGVIGK